MGGSVALALTIPRMFVWDECWPELVRAVKLQQHLDELTPQDALPVLEETFQAFLDAAPTPAAHRARWDLAAAARQLRAACDGDGEQSARFVRVHEPGVRHGCPTRQVCANSFNTTMQLCLITTWDSNSYCNLSLRHLHEMMGGESAHQRHQPPSVDTL